MSGVRAGAGSLRGDGSTADVTICNLYLQIVSCAICAIFENWVIVERLKAHLNRGDEPRRFFWRDNVGQEIDLIEESAGRLRAWECKSGMIFVPEWTSGLEKFGHLAGQRAGRSHLVYGGDESLSRQGIDVVSWRDAGNRRR